MISILTLVFLIISLNLVVNYFLVTYVLYRLHRFGYLNFPDVRSHMGYSVFRRELTQLIYEVVTK